VSVVAGVDGSPESRAALRFAIEEARARRCVVRAVHAWHVPPLAYGGGAPLPGDFVEGLEKESRLLLREAVAEVAPMLEGVVVHEISTEGDAGRVLVAESDHAELLVLGSRGHGALGELVLGSVGRYCCHHARCPVTVIPHRRKL